MKSYASDDTKSAGIGDRSSQLRAGGNVHASKNDWMLDLQEIGAGGSDLLW